MISTESQMTRFGRGAVQIRANYGKYIPNSQIERECPTVFAETKHKSRCERFAFISTREILDALARENFLPTAITMGGSKDRDKLGFTKHLIRLQRDTWMKDGHHQIGGAVPELDLLNAHDGTSCYLLGLGVLKIACLNGLTANVSDHWGTKVRHTGDVSDVIEAAYNVVNEADEVVPRIEDMTKIRLAENERRAFAESAMELHFEPEDNVNPDSLLRKHRYEDGDNSLWTTFNVVQENLVRGGVSYYIKDAKGHVQHRRSRPVRNIDGDLKLNRALWTLAEKMRELKS